MNAKIALFAALAVFGYLALNGLFIRRLPRSAKAGAPFIFPGTKKYKNIWCRYVRNRYLRTACHSRCVPLSGGVRAIGVDPW